MFIAGGSNNGLNSSQLVRQGLRAIVSGRTQQTSVTGNSGNSPASGIRRNIGSPLDIGDSSPNSMINQQQQLPGNLMNTPPDMDPSMRFNFDMPQGEHTTL